MANYATRDEVKKHVEIEDSNRDALIDATLPRASRMIDRWTRVPTDGWSDLQGKTITTQAAREGQQLLFLPLRIQSITSVTQNGILLTEGADDDFVTWDWYLEQIHGGRVGRKFFSHAGWTSLQQKIVIVGNFGFAAIPDEVNLMAVEATAIISGLKKNVFETNEGSEGAVLLTDMPQWVKDAVGSVKRRHAVEPYKLT